MMTILPSPVFAAGLKFGFDHASEVALTVCGVLLALSIVIWSVMILKQWMIGGARKADRNFLRAFHDSPHPLAIFQAREHHERAPLYHIYHAASRELAFHLLGTDEPDATFANRLTSSGRITASQMSAVTRAMERACGEAALRLEARMNGVGIVIAGAPFFGLIGTVWSVMDLLNATDATSEGSSGMTAGLCAALLPTLIGLLVAVPGAAAHRWIVGEIRALTARHEHFVSEFISVMERHFVDHRPAREELPSISALSAPNMPAFGGVRATQAPKPAPRAAREPAPVEA